MKLTPQDDLTVPSPALMADKLSLGAQVEWAKAEYKSKHPPMAHVLTFVVLLLVSWAIAYSVGYVLLDYVLFPDVYQFQKLVTRRRIPSRS